MKIIQSFWSANQIIEVTNFGWHSPKFHIISWALSSIQLSKFYDIELYTDQNGYDFLIKKLNLPYKKVHVVLDDLNQFHKDFWALPKIKSYMIQEEPFLHVDGDVYIWEPLPEELLKQSLISQNLEETTSYYKNMWDKIKPNLDFIPTEMKDYASNKSTFACNMGIFGGTDINFLQKYSRKSFEFATNNIALTDKIYGGNFNIFFEQVLFYEMMQIDNKRSSFLLREIYPDNEYFGFGNFEDVPDRKKYLHLIGPFKRSYQVCKLMEVYFINNYPDYFIKIAQLFPYEYRFFTNLSGNDFFIPDNIERRVKFIKSFNEKKDPKPASDEYLFNRDLTCLNQYNFFSKQILNNNNFYIRTSNGSSLNEGILRVKEVDNEDTIISMEDIDILVFEKIELGIFYHTLQKELCDLLDQDAIESENKLKLIINDLLKFYIKNRAIIIC